MNRSEEIRRMDALKEKVSLQGCGKIVANETIRRELQTEVWKESCTIYLNNSIKAILIYAFKNVTNFIIKLQFTIEIHFNSPISLVT